MPPPGPDRRTIPRSATAVRRQNRGGSWGSGRAESWVSRGADRSARRWRPLESGAGRHAQSAWDAPARTVTALDSPGRGSPPPAVDGRRPRTSGDRARVPADRSSRPCGTVPASPVAQFLYARGQQSVAEVVLHPAGAVLGPKNVSYSGRNRRNPADPSRFRAPPASAGALRSFATGCQGAVGHCVRTAPALPVAQLHNYYIRRARGLLGLGSARTWCPDHSSKELPWPPRTSTSPVETGSVG